MPFLSRPMQRVSGCILSTLLLFTALAGCNTTESSDAFATHVVATVIAQQTAVVLDPPSRCELAPNSVGLASISEFNAPGLDNVASKITAVNSISLNPTGACLAAADMVGASIIDLANRHDVIRYLGYQDEPLLVHWSPDGKQIAGSQKSRVVQIWDPRSGESSGAIRSEGVSDFVSFLAWSPNSRYLITLGNDQQAYIWNMDNKEMEIVLAVNGSANLMSAAWAPDGETLALGTNTGRLFFASFPDGELTQGLTESENPIISIEWSKDGKQLAYSDGSDIRIFDVEAGFPIQRLAGPQKQVLSFEWSPDGTLIAAGYAQAYFSVWQVSRAKELFRNVEFAGDVRDIEWTQDGKLIITAGSGGIKYWAIPE